jgi:hypothetical protein
MTSNHRRAMERAQRSQRMFAFQRVQPAVDDSPPVTLAASRNLEVLPVKAKSHRFPRLAGIFAPFRLKEAA